MTDHPTQVKASIKGPLVLKVGTAVTHNVLNTGCKVITISFPDAAAVDISAISFTNKYTAIIQINGKSKVKEESDESFKFIWKKLLSSKILMPHAHESTGAEAKICIQSSEFLSNADGVSCIKLILQQPSMQFTEFGVENIQLYSGSTDIHAGADTIPRWLSQSDSELQEAQNIKNCPPVDKISSVLLKMWATGKTVYDLKKRQRTSPDRFDKDGCYDINLLTYQ